MDEIEVGSVETVGEQLRAAREAKGLSLEEIASNTRIPTRHLESLEAGDWSKLPAPTYSIGFAKSFAGAVGLDRAAIGEQLRVEMGGSRPAVHAPPELFEPMDPKRVMPIGLVLGAIGGIILVALLLSWLNNRSLEDDSAPAVENVATPVTLPPTVAAPVAAAPVVITANEAAWIEVKDGNTILKQGELGPGQSFELPANVAAPTLTTAKPEALRISVGTADAPAIGPAGHKLTVSLKPAELMKGPQAAQPAATTTTASAAPTPAPRRTTTRPAPTAAPLVEPQANVATPVTNAD